jgi:hypothetical protein
MNPRRCLSLVAMSALALTAWVAIVAALTVLTAAPDATVAFVARRGVAFEVATAAGARVLDAGDFIAIVRSDQPGLVGRLYRAGAAFVVDARLAGGCRGMRRAAGLAMRL